MGYVNTTTKKTFLFDGVHYGTYTADTIVRVVKRNV